MSDTVTLDGVNFDGIDGSIVRAEYLIDGSVRLWIDLGVKGGAMCTVQPPALFGLIGTLIQFAERAVGTELVHGALRRLIDEADA